MLPIKSFEKILLEQFLSKPSVEKAKDCVIAYNEQQLTVPDPVITYLAEQFREENRPSPDPHRKSEEDYQIILADLMNEIAQSKDTESILSISERVAAQYHIIGDGRNSPGELLLKRMKEFKKRSAQ